MARPSEYDFNLCIAICEEVANGGHIMDILEAKDEYPSWSTFRVWKRDNKELQTLYVNAQQDKTEPITQHIKKVQLMCLSGQIDAATANTVMQTDKWFASKYYPKMFGDRVQHANDPDNPITNVALLNIDPLNDDATDNSAS
jgi:ATP sulfurylase